MTKTYRIQHWLALPGALCLLALFCLPANAQSSTVAAGFRFDIDQNLIALNGQANMRNLEAEIASVLANNGDASELEFSLEMASLNDYGTAAMWMPYTSVLQMREHPGLGLYNEASSNANIIGLEIILSKPENAFMTFENGSPVNVNYASGAYTIIDKTTMLQTVVDNDQVGTIANIEDGGSKLSVSFDNGGIRPGREATFNIYSSTGRDLDELFDADTLMRVIFEKSDTNEVVSSDLLRFGDIGALGQGINDFNADLNNQLMGGLNPGTFHFKGMVDPFSTSTVVVTNVPEPAGLCLLASGLACAALWRGKKSRS